MKQLTEKQRCFVREYLVDMNGAAAIVRAGYAVDHAETQACRLLKKPAVKAAVAEQIEARAARTLTTADWVVARLRDEATFYGEGASHGARVAALVALAKHLGLHEEKPAPPAVQFFINRLEAPPLEGESRRVVPRGASGGGRPPVPGQGGGPRR